MFSQLDSRESKQDGEERSASQTSSASSSSRRTSSRLETPVSDTTSSHRHHPYPALQRRASHAQMPSSAVSPPLHQPHRPLARHASQGYVSAPLNQQEGGPIGGSIYGQINLLADVAAREADDERARRGREREVVGWQGPALRSSSSHRAYGPPVRGWSESEGGMSGTGRRSHESQRPQQSFPHQFSQHTMPLQLPQRPPIPTRHPLSGLTLDKEYAPYVPGKFEADVKRVLLTPTFTARSRPRSPANVSSALPTPVSAPPAPPPQWPPHLTQTHGRAEPEHGRAWTYSLAPDPAHPPPPPPTPGVDLSLPPPKPFPAPIAHPAPTHNTESSLPTSGLPSLASMHPRPPPYTDLMSSFLNGNTPRPNRYWTASTPISAHQSQADASSRNSPPRLIPSDMMDIDPQRAPLLPQRCPGQNPTPFIMEVPNNPSTDTNDEESGDEVSASDMSGSSESDNERPSVKLCLRARLFPPLPSPSSGSRAHSSSLSSTASAPLPTRRYPDPPSPSHSLPIQSKSAVVGRMSRRNEEMRREQNAMTQQKFRSKKKLIELKTRSQLEMYQIQLLAIRKENQKLREENEALRLRGESGRH